MITSDISRATSKEELVKATEHDEELQKLITCLHEKKINRRDQDIKAYINLFDEMAVTEGLFFAVKES